MSPSIYLSGLACYTEENRPATRRMCAAEPATHPKGTSGRPARAENLPAVPIVVCAPDPEILAALQLITLRLNTMTKKIEELSSQVTQGEPFAHEGAWKMPQRIDTPGDTPAEIESQPQGNQGQGQEVAAERHAANDARKAAKDQAKAAKKAAKPADDDGEGQDEPKPLEPSPEEIGAKADSEGGQPE